MYYYHFELEKEESGRTLRYIPLPVMKKWDDFVKKYWNVK
jgi:hypothetical protein